MKFYSLVIIYLILVTSPVYAGDNNTREGLPGRRVGGGTRVWDELLIDVYSSDKLDCRSHPSRCTA